MVKQKGLSLVELMISITIGLILMTGVVQLFLSSKTTFATQQAMSRIQETGRLAMDFIARDVRMAGYMGCLSDVSQVTNFLNPSEAGNFEYRMEEGIEGFEAGDSELNGFSPAPKAETDVLVVRSASGSAIGVTKNNESGQLFGSLETVEPNACPSKNGNPTDRYDGLCDGDILVVSDCNKARIFQATNIQAVGGQTEINIVHSSSGDPGNADNNWGGGGNVPPEASFGPGAEIIKINHISYYVAEGISGPSLYQRVNGTSTEMLQGVEDMRVTYGRDTDGDRIPNSYVASGSVTDWSQVVTARVQLLVRSTEDNVLSEPQPYTFAGEFEDDPGDRRMRQVFTSTIGIRNRLP